MALVHVMYIMICSMLGGGVRGRCPPDRSPAAPPADDRQVVPRMSDLQPHTAVSAEMGSSTKPGERAGPSTRRIPFFCQSTIYTHPYICIFFSRKGVIAASCLRGVEFNIVLIGPYYRSGFSHRYEPIIDSMGLSESHVPRCNLDNIN
jgi:hypothetical protein